MFKVNNKDTRTKSLTSLCVSVVNFKHVLGSWVLLCKYFGSENQSFPSDDWTLLRTYPIQILDDYISCIRKVGLSMNVQKKPGGSKCDAIFLQNFLLVKLISSLWCLCVMIHITLIVVTD